MSERKWTLLVNYPSGESKYLHPGPNVYGPAQPPFTYAQAEYELRHRFRAHGDRGFWYVIVEHPDV